MDVREETCFYGLPISHIDFGIDMPFLLSYLLHRLSWRVEMIVGRSILPCNLFLISMVGSLVHVCIVLFGFSGQIAIFPPFSFLCPKMGKRLLTLRMCLVHEYLKQKMYSVHKNVRLRKNAYLVYDYHFWVHIPWEVFISLDMGAFQIWEKLVPMKDLCIFFYSHS